MQTTPICSYAAADNAGVVQLLGDALAADEVSPVLFARKVLLDPNFDPGGAPVVRIGDEVVGFLLAIARRRPLEDGPDDSDRGYITLFAVDRNHRRQGIGGALLELGLEYLRNRGRKRVLISPYAPNYWTPGVDVKAYPEAAAFLETRGFRTISRPISMEVGLNEAWGIPGWAKEREAALQTEGIRVQSFDPAQITDLTAFLLTEFPGDWQRYIRETMTDILLRRRDCDDLIVAYEKDSVVGFSQHEDERFGPFGVAANQRGRGIGAVLMFRTLESMKRKGLTRAYFMWTDDATAERVYKAAGFREVRRYAVMERRL